MAPAAEAAVAAATLAGGGGAAASRLYTTAAAHRAALECQAQDLEVRLQAHFVPQASPLISGTTAIAEDLANSDLSAVRQAALQAAAVAQAKAAQASLAATVEGLLSDRLYPPTDPARLPRSPRVTPGVPGLPRSPRGLARAATPQAGPIAVAGGPVGAGPFGPQPPAAASAAQAAPEEEQGVMLWTEPAPSPEFDDGQAGPPGLGSIQPNGRREVLQTWLLPEGAQASLQPGHPGGRAPLLVAPRSLLKASSSAAGTSAPSDASATSDLEWSCLADAQKHALRQWAAGQLGGRHCMLVLQHSGGADPIGCTSEETSMKAFRSGAALNVLSGLHAEVGLIGGEGGGEEGGLFEAVFAKPPQRVLEEALKAAVDEIGEPRVAQSVSDLTPEQAHLALRRMAMRAQQASNAAAEASAAAGSGQAAQERGARPKGAHEHTRVQIWLELLRMHVEGWPKDGAPGGVCSASGSVAVASAINATTAPAALAAAKDRTAREPRTSAAAPQMTAGAWYDAGVLRELAKSEADLEAESQQMSLEALRVQNRAIEEYVMRLVRQRDELKSVTKLAEERDSYFVLGLDGPSVSDAEVKRAYRNLARKEHPDKAGVGNKRRFQAIQQAYTNVQRQRREQGIDGGGRGGDDLAEAQGGSEDAPVPLEAPSSAVLEASRYANEAQLAAGRVTSAAHRALRSSDEAVEAQAPTQPKRRALRALRDLTRGAIGELRDAAGQLRVLGQAIAGAVHCLEAAMAELHESSSTSVVAIGLRDRAAIVEDAGRSSVTSAELLDKIAEATEATLRKVDAADAGAPPQQPGQAPRTAATRAGDESANLLRLGTRLLGESLARIAAVARRSADEAIGGAIKALELSRGLTALDLEARKERRRDAAKRRGFADGDTPMAAPDAPGPARPPPREEAPEGDLGEGARGEGDAAGATKTPRPKTTMQEAQTPRDQLKSAAKRVKERHVALRVKNLLFLASLNEEALKAQLRLRALLERSQGALLPEVSLQQKSQLFELIAQLLESAVGECSRLAAASAPAPAPKILEKALGFALALEHSGELAMPADSRTQALKLASLVDKELLCQVLDGPFRRRILAAGAPKPRPTGNTAGTTTGGYAPPASVLAAYSVRSRSGGGCLTGNGAAASSTAATAAAAKAWEEAANASVTRVVQVVRSALARPASVPTAEGEEGAG